MSVHSQYTGSINKCITPMGREGRPCP